MRPRKPAAPVLLAVVALVLAPVLSACGGHSGDGGSGSSGSSGGDYCTLVKEAKGSSPTLPKGISVGNADAAQMRRWIQDVADQALARTDAIIAAAPSDAVEGWKQIRKLQQNMVDGLRGLATEQNAAAWARMSREQRLSKLVSVLSGMGAGVDKSAIEAVQAQVQAYCGISINFG